MNILLQNILVSCCIFNLPGKFWTCLVKLYLGPHQHHTHAHPVMCQSSCFRMYRLIWKVTSVSCWDLLLWNMTSLFAFQTIFEVLFIFLITLPNVCWKLIMIMKLGNALWYYDTVAFRSLHFLISSIFL